MAGLLLEKEIHRADVPQPERALLRTRKLLEQEIRSKNHPIAVGKLCRPPGANAAYKPQPRRHIWEGRGDGVGHGLQDLL